MPSPGQRLCRRVLWFLTCLGILTTWSMATARYGGPDEPAHVLRAASVAKGQWLGDPVDGLVGGFRGVEVPAALATGDPRCFRHDSRVPTTCAVAEAGVTGLRRVATASGTYPPWYFAMVGIPVRLFGDASSVAWYRLVAAMWCAFVLTLAAARASRAGGLLVACITPSAWFLFGVVNPNAMEIALLLLVWVGVERLRTTSAPTGRDLWWVTGPAAIAILIRPIAAVAVMTAMVALAVGRRARTSTHLLRLGRRGWTVLAAPLAAAVIASIGWALWSGGSVDDERAASPLGLGDRIAESVDGTVDTLREVVGSLGWLEFSVPWVLRLAWWGLVLITGARLVAQSCAESRLPQADSGDDRAALVAWLSIAVAVIAVPIVFEAVLAGRLGFIWQGRYSLPTALGVVIVGMGAGVLAQPWCRRSLLAAAGLAEVLTLWWTLRRSAVGTDGSWWLHDAAWQPAVHPIALLAINAALIIWLMISGNLLPVSDGSTDFEARSARNSHDDIALRGEVAAQR